LQEDEGVDVAHPIVMLKPVVDKLLKGLLPQGLNVAIVDQDSVDDMVQEGGEVAAPGLLSMGPS
jgi:hypothetical protein